MSARTPPPCPCCAGYGVPLGTLGRLHWFRCRDFKALTGTSVQAWLLAERLALSQRLLEKTDQSVENVTDMAGFGSVVSLRHHFRRAFSVSPMTWRRNFGGPFTPNYSDGQPVAMAGPRSLS